MVTWGKSTPITCAFSSRCLNLRLVCGAQGCGAEARLPTLAEAQLRGQARSQVQLGNESDEGTHLRAKLYFAGERSRGETSAAHMNSSFIARLPTLVEAQLRG